MVMLRLRVSIPLVFIVSLFLFNAIGAQAHPGADWYPAKWPSSDRTVNWRFANNVPATAIRDRMKNGAAQWNAVSGSTMTFQFNTPDYSSFSGTSCAATEQKDAVHWGEIDNAGGTNAVAITCTFLDATGSGSNTTLHNFQIKLDHDETWYTGTGEPSSNAIDAWTIASHEFGHATGRNSTAGGVQTIGGDGHGHFFNTDATHCPVSTSRHTMCQTQIAGASYSRTLETHDKDAFANAY